MLLAQITSEKSGSLTKMKIEVVKHMLNSTQPLASHADVVEVVKHMMHSTQPLASHTDVVEVVKHTLHSTQPL